MDFAQIAQMLSSNPEADQQHRGLIQEVIERMLSSQGVDPAAGGSAGGRVPSANVSASFLTKT